MSDLIRDAPIGQVIRYLTKNRLLKYPEELEDWKCPHSYDENGASAEEMAAIQMDEATREHVALPHEPPIKEETEPKEEIESPMVEEVADFSSSDGEDLENAAMEKITTLREDNQPRLEHIKTVRSTTGVERVGTRSALTQSKTRSELEEAFHLSTLDGGPSRPVIPATLDDGTILVDWYTTDDPANPQNWSLKKKMFVTFQICMYTMAVYMGSSIYTPSIPGVMVRFGVNAQLASMGLSMYVLAYGLGPMLFSPLSELPLIGRNPPYMITFAIFVILLVPTALVDNFPGLIVLRFLAGFFGSPCLATGGASLQDMFSLIKLPYVLSLWALAATCGPALGPIISGFSVTAKNWRWSLWELLWLAGPIWILLFLCLPETSPSNILLRRANRLRKRTPDAKLKSQSEIDQANLKVWDLIKENLWRPNQMMVLDPAVGFTAIYTALVYAIFYSFFESFPLVYGEMYHFNLGELGLTFLSITVGVVIAIAAYWAYIYYIMEPEIRAHGLGAPERRLIPALVSSIFCPVGLFIFGWSSNPDVHWIGSVIGVSVFTIGIFIVLQ
ncbi:hypothetical protein EG327_011695, partial [Venturia inaequalis]